MPTAIITGASRGIGAATARLLASRGYCVAVNYVQDECAARSVVDEISLTGGRAIPVQGDMSIEADIVRLFETATREFGALTALVNNAGTTGGMTRVEGLTSDTLSRVMQLNVTGTVLCAREAVRRMSTRNGGEGGGIVNVSSLAARLGGAGEWVHYATAKGAVESFTVGLAREVANEGIRVNAVAPGLIETEIHATSGDPERLSRLAPSIPMRRTGTAEEVAEGICWLLSPASSYVTGTILEIGGGR